MPDRPSLRSLLPDEFDAWREREIQEYARDIATNLDVATGAAIEKATVQTDDILSGGLDTPGQYLFVLEDGGEPVGRLWLGERQLDGRRVLWIYDVHVEDAHRGRGLGRAAMELAEEQARALGIDRIELNVYGRNDRARRLYASMGYQELAIRMGKALP